jgi:hypothetical protein
VSSFFCSSVFVWCVSVYCLYIHSVYYYYCYVRPHISYLIHLCAASCVFGPFFDVKIIVGSFSTVCKSHTSTSCGYIPLTFIMCWSHFPYFLFFFVYGYLLLLLCVLCGACYLGACMMLLHRGDKFMKNVRVQFYIEFYAIYVILCSNVLNCI